MGVTVSDIGLGLVWNLTTGLRIEVSRSRKSACMHEPYDLGDGDDATDLSDFSDVLDTAATSKAAFVSAFSAQYPTAAADIAAYWTTAERDALWELAKVQAPRF
jgi:hypothetical protein